MARLFRLPYLKRFFRALREEGVKAAFSKARWWVRYLRTGKRDGYPSGSAASSEASGAYYLSGLWLDLASREGFHTIQSPALLSSRRKVAMIGDLNLPQCRKYRVEQLAELFQTMGIEYDFAHGQDLPRSANILQDATHVMFYRLRMDDATIQHLYEARRLRLPILYDIDDPLFSVSCYATYENMKGLDPGLWQHFLNEAPGYAAAMNVADAVSLSTPLLAEEAALHTDAPCFVRRNFADRQTLEDGARALSKMAEREADAPFRLVFASGSNGHEEDFDTIREDVIAFLKRDSRRRLRILGRFDETRLPRELTAQIESFAFLDYDKYLMKLAESDLALMPLTDDRFNACKSGVRVIDAASVGVPSLVGHVGDLKHVVSDGVTGHVIPHSGNWLTTLEARAEARSETWEMGRAARKGLEDEWSARATDPVVDREFVEFFR